MPKRSLHLRLMLAACVALVGCQGLPSALVPAGPASRPVTPYPRLIGKVDFGDRQTQATTGDIINRATVSMLDSANQTVAVTLTDASGNFTLDVNGTFTPTTGTYYTVEAVKGLNGNATTANAVRLRTLLQWTGSAWNSCTGATSLLINPTTTAVSILKATQSSIGYSETMGVVSGTTVSSTNTTLSGNWQAVQYLVNDLLWRDMDPVARIALNGSAYGVSLDRATLLRPSMGNGTFSSTSYMLDGSVQLSGSLPRPKTASELSFSVSGSYAAFGNLVCYGNYVECRPWTSASTYANIGTGFGGTTQGTLYGNYTNAPALAMDAGYYNGYIYQYTSGSAGNNTITRLNVGAGTAGAVDTFTISPSLIFRNTGTTTYGGDVLCSFITDGNYFYNCAYVINGGASNGYTVRVYDPTNSFALVRQLLLDGANTPLANTSYYSDSFMADGVYVYAVEWTGSGMARLRRYRLGDGQLEAETTFAQNYASTGSDDPIQGCYDPVNNKFWFGDYNNSTIHRCAGRVFPASGTWTSAPIDAGVAQPLYGRLNFSAVAVNGQTVRFQVRSAGDQNGLATATWYGPTGTGDYYTTSATALNPIHNRNRWLQIRASLTPDTTAMLSNSGPLVGGGTGASAAPNTTPRLYGVTVEAVQ